MTNNITANSQSLNFIINILKVMVEHKSSDLFITVGFPPAVKVDGKVVRIVPNNLTKEQVATLVSSVLTPSQLDQFQKNKELDFKYSPPNVGRFRVNAFYQQNNMGLVFRSIPTEIPTMKTLNLPDVLSKLVMNKNGLLLVVGSTGSGKSTTMAAMINYYNENAYGHILSIEDPIEFVHQHKNCIVTQREVGEDTESWENALKSSLRQAPNLILMGEVRDKHSMEHALTFAESGHLCVATIHANNANQALERIVNLFPPERHNILFKDIALNLRGIVSQRLLPKKEGSGRIAAIEILINTPLITDLITKGDISAIKEVMKKSGGFGMKTFDQAMFELFENNSITYEEALRNADSQNDLRLNIKLNSTHPPAEEEEVGKKKMRVM